MFKQLFLVQEVKNATHLFGVLKRKQLINFH